MQQEMEMRQPGRVDRSEQDKKINKYKTEWKNE